MNRFAYFFIFILSLVSSSLVSMQIDDHAEITILTIDGSEFKVLYGVIKKCETINQLVQDTGIDCVIPIPNLTSENLNHIVKIIEFSQLLLPESSQELKQDLVQKIENYIQHNIKKESMVALFVVANYLDCKIAMDVLFDSIVDYLNDKERLLLFEKNPCDAMFVSLPNKLLIQNVIIHKNRLYEWLLTMYEYDDGFCSDLKEFPAIFEPTIKCPLIVSTWSEEQKKLLPCKNFCSTNKLCTDQLIAPNGIVSVKFFADEFKFHRKNQPIFSETIYITPHFTVFPPDGSCGIIIHNEVDENSTIMYFSEITNFVAEEISLPGHTTCIQACNNAVARGTNQGIEVYDKTLKTLKFKLDCNNPTCVALSSDGDRIAYIVGHTLYIHSQALSETISFSYDLTRGMKNLLFNEDGTLLSFSVDYRICTRTIGISKLSSEEKKLVSNKQFFSSLLEKIPEKISYIPGTNLLAFSHDQVLYVINPCSQKILFYKRMNGSVTNIFFTDKKDTLFFLEELHTASLDGISLKKIDISFLKALDHQLSIKQAMLLKLIQDKIYKGLKLDLASNKNYELNKIFESLPVQLQQLLCTRVKLSLKSNLMLKSKLLSKKVVQFFGFLNK